MSNNTASGRSFAGNGNRGISFPGKRKADAAQCPPAAARGGGAKIRKPAAGDPKMGAGINIATDSSFAGSGNANISFGDALSGPSRAAGGQLVLVAVAKQHEMDAILTRWDVLPGFTRDPDGSAAYTLGSTAIRLFLTGEGCTSIGNSVWKALGTGATMFTACGCCAAPRPAGKATDAGVIGSVFALTEAVREGASTEDRITADSPDHLDAVKRMTSFRFNGGTGKRVVSAGGVAGSGPEDVERLCADHAAHAVDMEIALSGNLTQQKNSKKKKEKKKKKKKGSAASASVSPASLSVV
jgi:hypothetical protein